MRSHDISLHLTRSMPMIWMLSLRNSGLKRDQARPLGVRPRASEETKERTHWTYTLICCTSGKIMQFCKAIFQKLQGSVPFPSGFGLGTQWHITLDAKTETQQALLGGNSETQTQCTMLNNQTRFLFVTKKEFLISLRWSTGWWLPGLDRMATSCWTVSYRQERGPHCPRWRVIIIIISSSSSCSSCSLSRNRNSNRSTNRNREKKKKRPRERRRRRWRRRKRKKKRKEKEETKKRRRRGEEEEEKKGRRAETQEQEHNRKRNSQPHPHVQQFRWLRNSTTPQLLHNYYCYCFWC